MPDMEKITWGMLLDAAVQALEAAGLSEARRAAMWLLGEVLGVGPAHLVAYPEREATPEQADAFAAMLARRLQREPLQYILGYTDFYGLPLRLTPAVFIPRPETEQVVEAALGLLQGRSAPRVLDVGTGSGCMALVLKHERTDAEVYACDVSPTALDVARTNAEAHHLAVTFFLADVLASNFPDRVPAPFDLIISNPPYIAADEVDGLAPEVRDYEPHLALFVGNDPLRFYRALIDHAGAMLAPGGVLVFETHAHHADAVGDLVAEAGFTEIHGAKDLAGLPRIVTARHPVDL